MHINTRRDSISCRNIYGYYWVIEKSSSRDIIFLWDQKNEIAFFWNHLHANFDVLGRAFFRKTHWTSSPKNRRGVSFYFILLETFRPYIKLQKFTFLSRDIPTIFLRVRIIVREDSKKTEKNIYILTRNRLFGYITKLVR